MEDISKLNLEILSESEILDIDGGGIFEDIGYAIGYAFGTFWDAQGSGMNGNIGGPSARY
ncbi:hypothetical protein [Sphingobacterium corticibacter]|uniref:Bacteriocin n=1 Tax=Sphingobacterium corticibacter TaxID=2171749 RepID=A0A2T8HFU0_9SPHI|nr:hypothetical protein [Sphingobacterium corticibacter]PVH24311.1 hypothetical protein DC487_14600 [Sphingobacterium corticibacter]